VKNNLISLKKISKPLGEDKGPFGTPLSLIFQTYLKFVTGPYMPTYHKGRIVVGILLS
jgi:hypothetical protein